MAKSIEEMVDYLMDDWLERDGETFVSIRKTDRLGWEKSLEEDAYSSYFLKEANQRDLIKYTYETARTTLAAMCPGKRLGINVTGKSDDSFTDGKCVTVSTKMFDETGMPNGEKLDIFTGVVIHEGSHVNYSDFTMLKDPELRKRMAFKPFHMLWNIIEDEMIERHLGEDMPGFALFLEKVKLYIFEDKLLDAVTKEDTSKPLTKAQKEIARFLQTLLQFVRYPKFLQEEDVKHFAEKLVKCKEILTPYPGNTEESVKAAKKIFEVIKEFFEELSEEEKKSMTSGEGGEPEETPEKMSPEEFEKKFGEAVEKLVTDMETIVPADGRELEAGKADPSSAIKDKKFLLGDELEGRAIVPADGVIFEYAKPNRGRYTSDLSEVKKYAPAIQRILKAHCKEYKLIHRSMRSGVLDTNKLADAIQGVPTVYLREGEVKTEKVAVCVLIDESGSMSGSKINSARKTAILINEAVGKVPGVDLFIYGHTGDVRFSGATEITIYREKEYAPRYVLGAPAARCQNRDGVAIIECAKRVRKLTPNECLYFVLSDGAPAASSYGGESAIKHTRDCVIQAEKLGFNVIQVCIDHCYDPKKMFRNFVILDDMATLPNKLAHTIKRATMNKAKVSIT